MTTTPDYQAWFDEYAGALTRSLDGEVEIDRIRGFYAQTVLALGENGTANAARTDDQAFADMMTQMHRFYAAVGTRKMSVDRVEVAPLAPAHDRVTVFFRGDYRKPDGKAVSIPFDVTYLTQRRDDGPVVFAYIAGDEMALFRRHGLVDADGKPLAA